MAKADAKDKKDAKKGDGKTGKKGDGRGPVMSVARHPAAGPSVRRAKGLGGLAGFAVAGLLSYQANVPLFDVGLRAIGVGVAGYLVAWACSVTVWRVVLTAELRMVYDELYPPPELTSSAPTDASAPPAANATEPSAS